MSQNFPRRLAFALAHYAARRLPPGRAAWAEPMRHEVESIESDWAALRWAVGCVVASYSEGVKTMNTSSLTVFLGVVGLIVLIFGGFIMHGGQIAIIIEALPAALLVILGGALATTFILTSAGGPGIFKSVGLALRGRRFLWGDYRLLAATLRSELGMDSSYAHTGVVLNDGAVLQTIRDAKALLVKQLTADHVGSILQSRIDAMLASQRRGVNVLKLLGRSLLWFGGIFTLLGAIHILGVVTEPAEVLGGMVGSASTGIFFGILFAAGFVLPLAYRLDAVITMDGNFYAFIRTAFVCRAAGSDAALAVRAANGVLPADLALNEGELDALSHENAHRA